MVNNEQNQKRKTTGILLSVLAIISLVLITAGVTYAFFSYAKEGLTENALTTGSITFYYEETDDPKKGIKIENAVPMSDEAGKVLANENEIFNFKITATQSGGVPITYKVTARRRDDSNLNDKQVKLYLTATGDATATNNKTVVGDVVQTFGNLEKYDKAGEGVDERILYQETIDKSKTEYTGTFVLRMWLNAGSDDTSMEADYSPYEFIKKTVTTTEAEVGDNGIYNADKLIENKELITSTTYYALPLTSEEGQDSRANYERIALVNQDTRQVVSATAAKDDIEEDSENGGYKIKTDSESKYSGFVVSEQFYQLNGEKFSVIVNVYANAEVIEKP